MGKKEWKRILKKEDFLEEIEVLCRMTLNFIKYLKSKNIK